MAALPPITQLSGDHRAIMEGYWSMLDPKNTGKVEAGTAAAFLKKSQLREPVLHKIWNMSDPTGKGYLDMQGLFMALRLIAVCQAGKDPTVTNMALSDPPPKFMGVEVPVVTLNKWTIDDAERAKYEKSFQSLKPSKGLLDGNKARPFMMQSKLPRDTLGKIWGLSDIDKDGNLDFDEFCVTMKLISLAQSGEVLPASLPSSLIPPSKSKATPTTSTTSSSSSAPPSSTATTVGGILPLPTSLTPTPSDSSPSHGSPIPPKKMNATPLGVGGTVHDVEWVVSAELKSKYDGYFQGIDKDHDGYVSGEEARSLFMASNLQQPVLAHIWNLCDIEKNGKLNAEQFALAMHLIAERVRKKEVPKELTPAMIPPSLRSKVPPSLASSAPPTSSSTTTTMATSFGALTSGLDGGLGAMVTAATTVVTKSTSSSFATSGGGGGFGFGSDFSAIQELDSISNEVESIRKEKLELAEDIKAKQELIQQRKAELEGFQEDMGQATRQREDLEREKEEARNLLEQLNSQKAKFEGDIAELKQKCGDEKEEIERLKLQLSEQETSQKSQADELSKLQEQLEHLRKEEQEYKQKVEMGKVELNKLQKANSNLNSEIVQVQQRIEGLKEEHQSLTTALTLYAPTGPAQGPSHSSSGVVNINDVGKLSAELHVPHMAEHDAISARATAGSSSPVSSLSGFSTNSHLDEGTEEGGGGAKEDKSHPDPFSSTSNSTRDPFAAFTLPAADSSAFGSSGRSLSGKPSDLSAFDPFGSGGSGTLNFDPFKSTASASSIPATGEELFGGGSNDPFSGGSSAHISSSSSANSLPPSAAAAMASSAAPPPAVDPFSGQDPFNADPFGGHTTAVSSKDSAQPTSLWGSSTPFDVDPFGQASLQTPTDPFSGADPFGEDPFKSSGGDGTSIGSSSGGGGGGNPFS